MRDPDLDELNDVEREIVNLAVADYVGLHEIPPDFRLATGVRDPMRELRAAQHCIRSLHERGWVEVVTGPNWHKDATAALNDDRNWRFPAEPVRLGIVATDATMKALGLKIVVPLPPEEKPGN